LRADGRAPDDLRPIKITPDFVTNAEGSVLIEAGLTRVIVTATMEDGVPSFLKGTGKGWVTGEYSMLKALVRHPRQPLSRDKLAQLARGREFEPFDRSLDVQISRLRKMIEPDPAQPRYIQTVFGVGYRFADPEA